MGLLGGVDDQQLGGGGNRRTHGVQVQRPFTVDGHQRHTTHLRTHDGGLRREVGPHRGDGHHLVTRIHHRLYGQHQGADTARGDGDAARIHRRVQPAGVAGHRFTQLRQPEVVRIKGFTALQGVDGGLANEVGRDLVALTKPEGQHVVPAETCVGDFTDFGGF